ncbi:MAG: S41 family peptidase [Candidatus Xenobium sp.]|jgi:carboxyl-terminal processing protease|nr:S41 family peptidase [Burkholderiales bacterium]
MVVSLRKLLLVLPLLVPLTFPALAAPPKASPAAGLRMIETVMTLVRNEYLEEVTPSRLVNGALDGMRLLLEERKLDADFLEHVPDSADRKEAMAELKRQYGLALDRYPDLQRGEKLAMETIQGMLKALDDPYTIYMNPEEYALLQESMSGGNFGGLGIYIELDTKNAKQLTIVEPMEDTPASRAGLRARDQILRIDGKSTRNFTIEQSRDMLRGPVGSKIVLTIRRRGVANPFDVTLTREQIHVNSVSSELLEKDGHKVGLLKLRIFGDSTNVELEQAMRLLESQGAEAFILDVRNNGGGYINTALDVCSKFVPTGSRIVSVVERGVPEKVHNSLPNLRNTTPLVVLVNEFSASASEITAGALKDLGRGVLVGVKTFGKGSVQKIYPLRFPEGKVSALKLTTAHYLTPSGRDIHKLGIEPDIKVEMPGEKIGTAEDLQVQKALDVLMERISQSPAPRKSSIRDAVRVASVQEQRAYIEQALQVGSDYEVLDRRILGQDEVLLEQIRVKGPDGRERTFLFDLSPYLGQ